jgi:hypothetical protein
MSAILSKITPWIANTVFDAMTFDPDQKPKLDRKTRIVQIVSLPELVHMTWKNKPYRSYIRFIISDSKNHIPVYICQKDDNNDAVNDEVERLRHGSLVRLKYLQVSTHNLLGVSTNTNLNKPTCLVVHVVPMNPDSLSHKDAVTISDGVTLESMGCENAGIIGNPLDVHEDIDVKRALMAMKYDHRTLARQVIDCFNYIVSGPSFETKGEKMLPGNNVIIGTYDSTTSNTREEWSSILSLYMNVKNRQTSINDSNENDPSFDGNDQQPCHSAEPQSGQEDQSDGKRSTFIPKIPHHMTSISQMLESSSSEESDDSDSDDDSYVVREEKMETQIDHGMYESQPDSNQDVDRLETQAPYTGHDDIDDKDDDDDDNDNMSESPEQELNLIETQAPATAFECSNDQDSQQSMNHKDEDSEQSSSEDDHYLETQPLVGKIQESPEHDNVDFEEASEVPAILQTQPLNTIGYDLDSDDDYHSAHSDFMDNTEEKEDIQGNIHKKKNERKKKKVMSVSSWLKSQSDSLNPMNEPWSQPSIMDSQLSNGTKKRKVLSVSRWLKKEQPFLASSPNPNESSKIPFDHENHPNYLPPSSSYPQNDGEQEDVDHPLYTSQSSDCRERVGIARKKKVFSVSAWRNNDIDF